MTTRRLVILTGPQGAGNHLFAKLLSLHPDVVGWPELLSTYWVRHQQAPFLDIWTDPSKLARYNFQYAVASISVPYVELGETRWPKIKEVLTTAKALGVDASACIIVRDSKINRLQQERVRGQVSLDRAVDYLAGLPSPHFLSHESVYLYKATYLRALSSMLNFPIAWDDDRVGEILGSSSNDKYVTQSPQSWLDMQVGRATEEPRSMEHSHQSPAECVHHDETGADS